MIPSFIRIGEVDGDGESPRREVEDSLTGLERMGEFAVGFHERKTGEMF